MAPKKIKDLMSSPVYSMPHDQQVQLLSEALLREYMHRRGYLATLKTFDEENPRDENTISSRALMSDLMALQSEDQTRLKEEGIETIMEMLCDLRVERRLLVEELVVEANAELPAISSTSSSPERKLKGKKDKKKKKDTKEKARHKDDDERSDVEDDEDRDADDGIEEEGSAVKHKSKLAKRKSRKEDARYAARNPDVDGGGMTIDDLLGGSTSSSASSGGSSGAEEEGSKPTQHGPQQQQQARSAPAWLGDSAAADTRNATKQGKASEHLQQDDLSSDEGDDKGYSSESGSTPLSCEAAQAACRVLCGRAAHPSIAFLRQGFAFDEEFDCTLIQWEKGPGAALAVIQALTAAFYYAKDVYVAPATRRRDALLKALSTSLCKAQPNPQHIILVAGNLPQRKDPTMHFFTRVSTRFSTWTGFESTAAMEERLATLLREDDDDDRAPALSWATPKGSGLLCFLLSLVLSRGSAAVEKDMDAPPHALIHEATGTGTIELASLCLCGRAVSNTHNGTLYDASGAARKGYSGGLLCGMLNGDAASVEDERDFSSSTQRSFSYAMEPTYPSWIVCHKDHFTNLYMKKDTRKLLQQKRDLGGGASFTISFWDAATEDDEVDLTVIISGAVDGKLRRRNAASFVNTAILSVPAWRAGSIDWGDHTPIRN